MEKIISASQISKSFHLGDIQVKALQNISFSIESGEIVTVIGRSGSGKTTLLNILGGLATPDSGEIVVAGKRLYEMKESQLARWRSEKIGYIFQTFNLVHELNVLENIRLPLDLSRHGYDIEWENELISMLGLKERLRFYPHRLSGGERQRVAIARAMIRRPAIILADEPSGNIDSEAGHRLMEFVQKTNKEYQQTYLIVTHDISWNTIVDRTVQLQDGKLLGEDSHGQQ